MYFYGRSYTFIVTIRTTMWLLSSVPIHMPFYMSPSGESINLQYVCSQCDFPLFALSGVVVLLEFSLIFACIVLL